MKIRLKYSLLLLLSIAITECINGITLLCFSVCFTNSIVPEVAMIIVSLFMYFILGKKFISQLTDKKILRESVLYVSIFIILSNMISIKLTEITGQYYIIVMALCSPIGNILAYPFSDMSPTYDWLLCVFAPVNVVLIWLFSKIKTRKKPDNIEDEYLF